MWKIVNREIIGKSHISSNIPCQDKTYALTIDENMVCALSDGAGSCVLSHLGAEVATKSVSELLMNDFDNLFNIDEAMLKDIIINNVINSIRSEYGSNIDIKNYSGTLLCVAVKNGKMIAASIGDSLIATVSKGNSKLLFKPSNGEFKNETYFFTSKRYPEKLNIYRGLLGDIDGFVLMSDGTAESLYSRHNDELAEAVTLMTDWLVDNPVDVIDEAIQANLEQVFSKKTIDDCSIVLAKYIKPQSTTLVVLDLRSKFGISSINLRKTLNQIKSMNDLLSDLNTPISMYELKNKTNFKYRKLKRLLTKLEDLGIIMREKGTYFIK